MSVTELTIFKLRDANTFNPMSILELLRQIVATCSHVSGHKFKAYQEREEFSKFYLIGGWQSAVAHKTFAESDTHKRLLQLLDSTLEIVSTDLIQSESDTITTSTDAFVAVERFEAKDRPALLLDNLQTSREEKGTIGLVTNSNTVISLTTLTKIGKEDKAIDSLDESLKKLTISHSIRHIEVNQFI